jgi:hypothetical protein
MPTVNDGGDDTGDGKPRSPGAQPAPAKPAGEAARFTAEEEKQLRAEVQGGELPK